VLTDRGERLVALLWGVGVGMFWLVGFLAILGLVGWIEGGF
jgi:hypothetical protein